MNAVLPGENVDPAKLPKLPVESLANETDFISFGGYLQMGEQYRWEQLTRRVILVSLGAGMIWICSIIYNHPEQYKTWVAIGTFVIIACDMFDATRCRNIVDITQEGREIEALANKPWCAFFTRVANPHFSRWTLTRAEWFGLAALLIMYRTWDTGGVPFLGGP